MSEEPSPIKTKLVLDGQKVGNITVHSDGTFSGEIQDINLRNLMFQLLRNHFATGIVMKPEIDSPFRKALE
jgi:hypothetical protein